MDRRAYLSATQLCMRCARLAGLALLMLVSRSLSADDAVDPFDLEPEQLFDAVVLSGTKTEATWWRTPAAVYVLTSEDIARSGATSIPEVLRLVPGVHVARVNASHWAISTRGFNGELTNKLLVLMDGRQLYNQLFSGVIWDVQDTPLEDIERIEVIRGPGATLWGSNAVNGVINILTKSAHDTQGDLLSVRAGNEESGLVARRGLRLDENTALRFHGKYLLRDDQRSIGGGRSKDDWTAFRTGFRGDWNDPSGASTLTLQGDAYRSKAAQFVAIPLLVTPFRRTELARNKASGGNLLGRYTTRLESGAQLSAQAYLDYTERRGLRLDEDFYAGELELQYATTPWAGCDVVAGATYRYEAGSVTESPTIRFSGSTRRENDLVSAFLQTQLALVPERLVLTLGSKIEDNDYTNVEVQPNARLQWTPDARQTLWTSVSRAVRTPSRLEHEANLDIAVIATTPVPVLGRIVANPGFTSERLVAYEAGYRRDLGHDVVLDLAAFYNVYENLATNRVRPFMIVNNGVDPLHVVAPIEITNATEGRARGFELVMSWQASDALQLTASYSMIDVELTGPPPNVALGVEVAERNGPDEQLRLRALWDIDERTRLDTHLHYVDEISGFDLDSYWRLDLRLSRRFGQHLELALVGQDLLTDARRELQPRNAVNVTEIQRGVYAQVTWRY